MDQITRQWFVTWVSDSFRDTADIDYIAARVLKRSELFQPAAWSALQCVEKYLKAILLFSFRSVKGYRGHDLERLLSDAQSLPHLKLTLPPDSLEFLSHLNAQGPNRYLDYPAYVQEGELNSLDRLVWYLRRYCQDFRLLPGDSELYPGESEKRLSTIPFEADDESRRKFRILGGLLERILDNKGDPRRVHLVWKNFYYGAYCKRRIHFKDTMSWKRPIHVMRPALLSVIEEKVFFPKDVLMELRKLAKEED